MAENFESRRSFIYEEEALDGIDLLSNLPDSIICLIISKLETKEAVKTSVLSSRYKSLWKNITSLSFKYKDFRGDEIRFTHLVNRILILLKSKSINEFCLTVETPCHLYDIQTWFSAVICMNVKVIKLVIDGREGVNGVSMPPCLYTSKTLEVLDIWNRAGGNLSLDVPEFVSLPKLTTLRLNYVNYSSDESVRRLISGCSSLEKLIIGRDAFDGVTTFTIDSPTIKTLNYYFSGYDGSIEEDLKFELKAPALREFCLRDRRSSDFSVTNLCSLEFAKIHVCTPKTDSIDSHYEKVVQLIQGIHNVLHLWISGDALEALSRRDSQESYFLNDALRLDTNYSKQSSPHDPATNSHDFYLSEDCTDSTHVVRWTVLRDFPVFLPVCLLSYLKTISVSGFRGRESELSMIAYILKNARVLEKITISEATSETKANFELREKILKFDQGSRRCEIIFPSDDSKERHT